MGWDRAEGVDLMVVPKPLRARPHERGVRNALGEQPRVALEIDGSRRVGLAA